MPRCDLLPGDVIFYEKFEGVEGLKDRYFIVVRNGDHCVECLTTTTQDHAREKPWLASDFLEIPVKSSCLPKRCFVDLGSIYSEDDVVMANRVHTRRVRVIGRIDDDLRRRLCEAIHGARTLAPAEKRRLVESISAGIAGQAS